MNAAHRSQTPRRRGLVRARTGATLGALLACALLSCANEPVHLPETGPKRQPTPRSLDVPKDPVVLLGLAQAGAPMTQLGSADVSIDVVSLKKGAVTVVEGRDGGPALRFPRYSAQPSDYPRAVVAISNAGDDDQLNPGARAFTWGAEFRIDKLSAGSPFDNGDNLVQRGLSSQPALYKAEIDGDRPACTVRGDAGELIVRAPERIRPGWWTQIQCTRTASELAVFVTVYDPQGLKQSYASRVNGPVGSVTMADPSIPMTVGGKIGLDGTLIGRSTDQFNGLVMQPFYAVTGSPDPAG